MMKNVFFILIIFSLSKYSFAGETNWVDITMQESEILIGEGFIVDANTLTYEDDANAKTHTLWHWAFKPSGNITVNISWYKLQKNYYVNKNKVYLPKKQINWLVGEGKWKWNGKRKGFKSHKRLVNYRPFILKEYDDFCFLFGIHFSADDAQYVDSSIPYAVLEGYICRPSKDFSESEIHLYINNIGIKDLRIL